MEPSTLPIFLWETLPNLPAKKWIYVSSISAKYRADLIGGPP